jgi:hypothetical protein
MTSNIARQTPTGDETMDAAETTKICNRTYRVEKINGTHFRHIAAKGFDGYAYWLHGSRKACKLAYRSQKTGRYVIVAG